MAGSRILVIDDEEIVCRFLEQILKEDGYEVAYSQNAEKGVELAKKFKPHTALVDLSMPGLDGIEVLRRIKDADAECVVIMITGFGTINTAKIAMRLGAFDYLTKPFDPEYMKSVIRNGLETRKEERVR